MKNLMIPALALFLSAAAQAARQSVMDALLRDLPGRADDRIFLTKGISTRSLLPEEKPGS